MIRTRCRTLADPTAPSGPGAFAWTDDDRVRLRAGRGRAVAAQGRAERLRAPARGAAPRSRSLADFEPEAIEAAVGALAAQLGVGMGKLAQPLRVAVTGRAASPPLGETLAILGRDAVLRRIARCLALDDPS